MKLGRLKILGFMIIIFMIMVMPNFANAESGSATGSSINAHLGFRINFSFVLYLQVGSLGATVDTVTFDVDAPPPEQNWFTGDISPIIVIAAFIPSGTSLELTADSTEKLTGQTTGAKMNLRRIRTSGSGDFSGINNLRFDNSANQLFWSGTGSGRREGTLTYQFRNNWNRPPDTYTATVTYTLATP